MSTRADLEKRVAELERRMATTAAVCEVLLSRRSPWARDEAVRYVLTSLAGHPVIDEETGRQIVAMSQRSSSEIVSDVAEKLGLG